MTEEEEAEWACSRPWVPAADDNAATPNFGIVRLAPGEWAVFFEDNVEPEHEDAVRGRLCALALKKLRFEMEGLGSADEIRNIVKLHLLEAAEQHLIGRDRQTKRWSFEPELIEMLDKLIKEA